jgi:hypothetical protein
MIAIVMRLQTERENSSVILTAGEAFPDGTVIELLRDQACPPKLSLVRYRDGFLETKSEISHANRAYAPISVDPSVATAIRFPSRVASRETTRNLFTDAHGFLSSHLGQLDVCITALVFVIFATWLTPVLPTAPVLSIFVPPGAPKNRVLQILNMMCRRPLRLIALKRNDIPRVPMYLQPTLLLDEPDSSPAMHAILNASTERGMYISQPQGMVEVFGPKIILSRKLLLESDALRIALIPQTGQAPFLDKETEEKIADEFQARFLGYFIRNSRNVSVPAFDVNKLSPPMRELAQTFGAAIIGDDELQQRILSLLNLQDEEIRADRALSDDAVLLEALIFSIHVGSTRVRTRSIAEKACAIFKGRGSDKTLSPESAGWAIKRLGIPGGRIDRAGNGVELTESTCRLIHRLAQSHGVRAMDQALPGGCRFCRELRPSTPAKS